MSRCGMRALGLVCLLVTSFGCGTPAPSAPSAIAPPIIAPAPAVTTLETGSLEAPSPTAARVEVTGDALRVAGQPVLVLHDGRIAAADVRGGEHGFAVDAITRAVEAAAPGSVVIAIAPTAPYQTLARVLYSAGMAERADFELEVELGGQRRVVPVHLPTLDASEEAARAADVARLALGALGDEAAEAPAVIERSLTLQLHAGGPTVSATDPACTGVTSATLVACLTAIRAARPELGRVILAPDLDVPSSEVIRTLATVRGTRRGAALRRRRARRRDLNLSAPRSSHDPARRRAKAGRRRPRSRSQASRRRAAGPRRSAADRS